MKVGEVSPDVREDLLAFDGSISEALGRQAKDVDTRCQIEG
jgi:hypothetical protein